MNHGTLSGSGVKITKQAMTTSLKYFSMKFSRYIKASTYCDEFNKPNVNPPSKKIIEIWE